MKKPMMRNGLSQTLRSALCSLSSRFAGTADGAGDDEGSVDLSRRLILGGAAACLATTLPTGVHAFSVLRGQGNFRRIRMYSGHSGESLDVVYWIDGVYVPEALHDVSRMMRDLRTGSVRKIDPAVVDIMAAAHRMMDVSEPYTLLSGYRTPQTNAAIRARGGGAARNSLHMRGQAADLRLRSRSISQMAKAAAACNSGGVGTYSRSNFVHMDCGPIRLWRG
jgi:uncharacterized protein YcbK (DUF882 family)